MAGLIYELIGVLKEEECCYQKLLQYSKEKTEIIVKREVDKLQQLTKKEQEIAAKTVRLEKKRENIVEDITLVLNQDKDALTITKLIDLLQTSPEEQQELKMIQSQIGDVLLALKTVNDQNKMLLNQALEFIDFTLNAIQSTRSFTTNDYQHGGKTQQQSGRNFFDAKQ